MLTLREGANGGRYFTIIGREEGPEEDLFVQGTFDLDSDREITLFPDTGPRVEFEYSIPDSLNAELRLSAEEGVSEDQFLNLI